MRKYKRILERKIEKMLINEAYEEQAEEIECLKEPDFVSFSYDEESDREYNSDDFLEEDLEDDFYPEESDYKLLKAIFGIEYKNNSNKL